MTRIDILLTPKTSGWIAVHNNGGRKSVKTAEFLARANREGSFETVLFGDEPFGVGGTYAIKREHIIGFMSWAFEWGLNANFAKL